MPFIVIFRPLLVLILGVACSLELAGCSEQEGPDLGQVIGTVTLDGKPLEGASLSFQPEAGRSSKGFTDESGNYELQFTLDRKGAVLGQHMVEIISVRSSSGGEGGEPLVEGRKEILPARYHSATELTANIKPGRQTINFELTSDK